MNDELRVRRRYFGLLLLLLAAVSGYLILTRRFPRGHDSQSVFLLQYLFQAQAAPGSGAILWLPAFAHGVISTWFSNLQAGLLQNVLLLAGGVPAGTPMLPVFYAGLFLEDLILLIGVWRLGGRYYRSPAAQFFVALAALGSSMWISNLYWNHRLIYAVPLLLSLFLDVLETGSRGKLFLAVSLLSLQLMGNAVYIPVLSGLAIGLFLALHVVLQRKRLRATLPLLRPRPADAAWLVALLLVVVPVAISLLHGIGGIRQYHLGRNPDGSVPLDAFLTFPGGMNPLRYLDLLLGLTPSKDYSLYCGLGTVLMAVLAFTQRPGKTVLHLSLCLLVLLLFSIGYLSVVGMAGYTAFYPLHYFRYVSLAAPLVKLFLILLAGFAFDALARPSTWKGPASRRTGWVLLTVALLAAQLVYLRVQGDDPSDPISSFLHRTRDDLAFRPGGPPGILDGVVAIAAAALFWACIRPKHAARIIPLLLLLQVCDVFRWRLQILRDETVPLEEPLYAVQKVQPLPYIPRRTPDRQGNERYAVFGRAIFESGASSGTTYDYCDAFLHRDPSWSKFYATQWSPSVDLLLRARAGRPLAPDRNVPPPFLTPGVHPPRTIPAAYAKLIGESVDKLQVFSSAHVAGSDEEIAAFINKRAFNGDVLLLSPAAAGKDQKLDPSLLERNDRLDVPVKVVDFGANRIRVETEVPDGGWLAYCDAWHPDWEASVNGLPATVERASLAYKAVRLQPGRNLVEFRFRAPLRALAAPLVGLLSLFWCGLLAVWTLRLLGIRNPVQSRPSWYD